MTNLATGSNIIRTDQVCRHYHLGESIIRAVDDVSLNVTTGDFIALLGSSGSGKSSLLNLIAGLDTPTSGSVVVDDKDLSKLSREELATYRLRTVGMVFQSFNLIPTMTLLENVELPMRFAEVERAQREPLARQALQRVGLAKRLQHRPVELSGGEQQRAALARALINRPQLLLADEPTGNLDSHTGTEVMDLIREINESLRMTVVMVTHERELAARYAKRMVFLADGRIIDDQRNAVTETTEEARL
jgi:putative ABC transport system ATP-binding protein